MNHAVELRWLETRFPQGLHGEFRGKRGFEEE